VTRERVEIERRRPFRQADIEARYAEQGGLCGLCRTPLGKVFIADHRVPRAMGGPTTLANLDLICPDPCNKLKTHGKGGDIAMVAKAKRIERKADPATRPVPKRKIKGRGFRKDVRQRMDGRIEPR
jgi:hypothetical protein